MTAEELFTIAINGKEKPNDRQVGGSSKEDPAPTPEEQDDMDTSDITEDQEDLNEDTTESEDSESEDSESEDSESSGSSDDVSEDENESEEGSSESEGESEGEKSESSSDGESEDEGESEGDSDSDSEGKAEAKTSQEHTCGSGAVGGKQPYEVDDTDDGSLNEYQVEEVRRETAKAILEESQNRGSVPGGLLREAQNILTPQNDWRRELPAVVRKKIASSMGKFDYSYSRPSRRSSASSFFMPALRAPEPPSIAIIIDTSGSVSGQQLSRVLAEVVAIIKRNHTGNMRGKVFVITCDAVAHVQEIKKASEIELIGGGGTDMRVGFMAAEEITPMPEIVLCITDGYTPFPEELYPMAAKNRSLYMVGIVPPKGRKKSFNMENIPSFIKSLYMNNF